PNGERKHAVEMGQCIPTPLRDRSKQDFRVAVSLKVMPVRTQFISKLAIIVNLAIEREDVAAIMRDHWLMPAGRRINNRQPPVTQARTPPGRINRLRNPNTLIVTPAMLDRVEHRLD